MKKAAPPLKKIQTRWGVTEYRLSNGLRVLYKKERAVPVVAVCITFHVGSRNEAAGHTGSTHILEHLLFKDSKHFNTENGKAISSYLEWMGARMNATTWLDRTNYFELLPKEKLAEALAMEADRMRNSLFSDADLASEMTVVRNEYERGRNNPYELLDEEVMATAFTEHPYRIPTIGTKEDIEHSTAAKLREFYDTFYWPANATLAIFGDVERADVEKLVVKQFGKIPRSPHEIPAMHAVEPPQKKARTCEIQKQAGVSIVQLAYKSPEARHEDFAALDVIATVLAGGFSSRMQERIVDPGIAADVHPMLLPTHDPGLCSFVATVGTETKPEKVLSLMRKEVAQLVREGITTAELKRARERLLSQMASARDGVFAEVRTLSEAVAAGDWTLAYTQEEALLSLTRAQVHRAAKKYLTSEYETAGILFDTL